MIITNMCSIPDREIQFVGLVTSSAVHAKHFGRDLMAGLKNVVGGELKGYSEMVDDAVKNSTRKLEKEAEKIGANGIVNISYTVTSMSQGSAIAVIASGTAVTIR